MPCLLAHSEVGGSGPRSAGFYVLDDGELSVTIGDDPTNAPEILRYEPHPAGGANPCFGELALLYSRPRGANVVARTDGILWAIDRKSFRAVLMRSSETKLLRTLRQVQILRSLSPAQLRRLATLLSEVTFAPGHSIIQQGDVASAFYVIAAGRAVVTKTPEGGGGARTVAELGVGDYFGEAGLLYDRARESSVRVPADGSHLKCYEVSKQAFEEVLGPLQDIITADSQWRVNARVVRQMRKARAKLTNSSLSDFVRLGVPVVRAPTTYILAQFTPKNATVSVPYTLKAMSKKIGHGGKRDKGQRDKVKDEMTLASQMFGQSRFVPMALTFFETSAVSYAVYATRVATTLRQLLDSEEGGLFKGPVARFYAASIVLALEHIQNELPAHGGVCLRDFSPECFAVDDKGYLQLVDLRSACPSDPPRLRDFVGYAHYQPPEVLAGRGHGVGAEYWGLGMLTYELVTGASPWLTGDHHKDTELCVSRSRSVDIRLCLPSPCLSLALITKSPDDRYRVLQRHLHAHRQI